MITKDHLNPPGDSTSRVGRGNCPLEGTYHLPYQFRLKDDDGEIYYEGRCGDLEQADEDHAFAPLDWAEADAGCTIMEYRKGNDTWRML